MKTTYRLDLISNPRLRVIAEILLKHQDNLSDGYGYYCWAFAGGEDVEFEQKGDEVVFALEKIAKEIYKATA